MTISIFYKMYIMNFTKLKMYTLYIKEYLKFLINQQSNKIQKNKYSTSEDLFNL